VVVVVNMLIAVRTLSCAAIVVAGLMVAPARAAVRQPGYASADDAVSALVQAVQKQEISAIGAILGPGSEALVRSGDPVKDRAERQKFLDDYTARHTLLADGADRMILHVGANDWPMPIPLVQQNGRWHFDSHAGAQEIVNRRIGRNELATIRFCLAYVDAQKDYFDLFKQSTGAGLYAQRLLSTQGNYDGLYWPSAPDTPDSPLAAVVASAVEEGYAGDIQTGNPLPYEGYYFRILKAQGTGAPGGPKNYLQGGNMVDGFALLAWPVTYGASGIMTFIVNQDGIVFQQDLGAQTAARAAQISTFNPTLDWARIDVEGQ
jgi:hypothetical protein